MKAAIKLLADKPSLCVQELGKRRPRAHGRGKKGRKILVIADMLELGKEAERCHEEIGRFIAHSGIDVLFTKGALAKISAQAVKESGMKKVFPCRGKQELIRKLLSELKPYDIMLVKGSRAMGMEEVVWNVECGLRDVERVAAGACPRMLKAGISLRTLKGAATSGRKILK
jgi:hypothetical protein